MSNQLTKANFLSMTSKEIAELCRKKLNHINRDIKMMLEQLTDVEPNLDSMYKTVAYKQKVGFGERDNIMYHLNEELTLTLVSGYNVKIRQAIIKQWQSMREALATLKYRHNDKKAQIEAMAVIGHLLPPEEAKEKLPYIKANTVVNKITSDIYGMPKMLQKDQMNLPMLETRAALLDDYVKLFDMGFDNHLINEMLRKKQLLLK